MDELAKLKSWAEKLRALAERPGSVDEGKAARARLEVIEAKLRELGGVTRNEVEAESRKRVRYAVAADKEIGEIDTEVRSDFMEGWLGKSRFRPGGESRKKEIYDRLRRYLDLTVSAVGSTIMSPEGYPIWPEKMIDRHLWQALECLEELLKYLERETAKALGAGEGLVERPDSGLIDVTYLPVVENFLDRIKLETKVKVEILREEVLARREKRPRRLVYLEEVKALE